MVTFTQLLALDVFCERAQLDIDALDTEVQSLFVGLLHDVDHPDDDEWLCSAEWSTCRPCAACGNAGGRRGR